MIELILNAMATGEAPNSSSNSSRRMELVTELQALKMSALRKRAAQLNIEESRLEEAVDSDKPKEAAIALIVEAILLSSS